MYDGQYIANTTHTVVITANYRLGALGYLVYGDSVKGNYGLKVGVARCLPAKRVS